MIDVLYCLTCKRSTEHDTSTQFVTCTWCGRVHERRTENAVLRDVHADGDTRREDEQEPGPSSRARVSAVEEQFLAEVKHLITEWLGSPRHHVLDKPCPELVPSVMHLYLRIREMEMLERRRVRDVRREQEQVWRETMIASGSNPDDLDPPTMFRNIKEGVNSSTRNVPYQVLTSIKLAVQEEYLTVLYSRLQEPGGDEPETKPAYLARRARLTSLPRFPTVPDLYDRTSSTAISGFQAIDSDKYLTAQCSRLSKALSRLLDPVDRVMINVLGLVQHLEHVMSLPTESRVDGVKSVRDRAQLVKSFDAMNGLDFDAVLRSAYNLYRALQCVYLWPRGWSLGLAVALLMCALHIEIGSIFPESKVLVAQLGEHIGGAGITESHACIAAIKRFIIAWSTSIPDANLVFEVPDVEAESARAADRKARGEPVEQPGDQPILKTAPFPQIRHPDGKDTGDGYAGWAGDWRRGIPPNEMFRLGGRVVIDHWKEIMETRLRTRDSAMDYQEEEDMARELFSQYGYHPKRHRRRPAGTATPSRRQPGSISAAQASYARPSAATARTGAQSSAPSPTSSMSSPQSGPVRLPSALPPSIKAFPSGTAISFNALPSPPPTSEPASPPTSPHAKQSAGTKQTSASNFWRPARHDAMKEVEEMLARRDDSSDEDVGRGDDSTDEGFADDNAVDGRNNLIGLGLTLADKQARLRQSMIEAERASPRPSLYAEAGPSHLSLDSTSGAAYSRRSRHSSVTSNASSAMSRSRSVTSDGGTSSPASTAARSLASEISATMSLRSIGSVLASENPVSFKKIKWRLYQGLMSRTQALDLPQNRHIGVLARERDQYLAKWQLALPRYSRTAEGPNEIDDGLEAICLYWVEKQREAGTIPDVIDRTYLRSIGLDAEDPMQIDLGSWVEDNLHKWSPIEGLLRAGIQPRQIPDHFMPHSETALWLDLYEYRTPLYFRLLQGVDVDPGQDGDGDTALNQLFEVGPERLSDFINTPSEVKRLEAYHEANKTFEGLDFDEDGFSPSQRLKHQRAIEKAARQARDKEMRRRREEHEAELEMADRPEDEEDDIWMLNQIGSGVRGDGNEKAVANEQEVYRQFTGEYDGIALNRDILGEALGEDAAEVLGERGNNDTGGSSPEVGSATSAYRDAPASDDGESSDDESGSSSRSRLRAQVSELRKVAMEGRKAREAKLQAIKDQERAAASALRAKKRAEAVEAQRLEALQRVAARRAVEAASARERAHVNAENAEYWRQQKEKKRLQAEKRAKKAEAKTAASADGLSPARRKTKSGIATGKAVSDSISAPAQSKAVPGSSGARFVSSERNPAAEIAAKLVQKAREDHARAKAVSEEQRRSQAEEARYDQAPTVLVDLQSAARSTPPPRTGQKRKSPDHPDDHSTSSKRPSPDAPPVSAARVDLPAPNKRVATYVASTAPALPPVRPVAIPITSLLN